MGNARVWITTAPATCNCGALAKWRGSCVQTDEYMDNQYPDLKPLCVYIGPEIGYRACSKCATPIVRKLLHHHPFGWIEPTPDSSYILRYEAIKYNI